METQNRYPLPYAVLSRFQTAELLKARQAGLTGLTTSLDLELSHCQVRLDQAGVRRNEEILIGWNQVEAIQTSENGCFRVQGGASEEIRGYSEANRHIFSLLSTREAPALLLSGFTMHRFKGITPCQAALTMIKAAAPISGRVLDTATGLGYTAIAAALSGATVVTIELDPGALAMAQANPWSQELFFHPGITRIIGDSNEEIKRFPDGHFQSLFTTRPV